MRVMDSQTASWLAIVLFCAILVGVLCGSELLCHRF